MVRFAVGILLVAACAKTPAPTAPAPASLPCQGATALAADEAPSSEGLADLTGEPIARVDIVGLDAVPESMARDALTSAPGKDLDANTVAEDIRRLWKLETFAAARAEASATAEGVVLRFVVTERRAIDRVHIAGDNVEPDLPAWSRLRHLRGTIYNPIQLQRTADDLRREHRRKGYTNVEVRLGMARGTDGRVDVCVSLSAGKRFIFAGIEFEGNKRVSDKELAKLVEHDEVNKSGTQFDRDRLDLDLVHVHGLYYDRGLIQVKIGEPVLRTDIEAGRTTVVVPIEEGHVFRLGKIAITGEAGPLVGNEAYLKRLGLRRGMIFNRTILGNAISSVTTRLRADGASDPLVTPVTNIDLERRIVDLDLEVELQ